MAAARRERGEERGLTAKFAVISKRQRRVLPGLMGSRGGARLPRPNPAGSRDSHLAVQR